ncbi:MAG: MFS transporter [Acidobacteria bacterium]|nr:MFS transporter [Acidobacteriota bacterium]
MGLTAVGAPDWRRNLAAVTVATFIGFTGFTLVMPFLPLYFEQLGVSDPGSIAVWSGLSLGVTPAVTALMAPLWARVAERYGRKLMVARSLLSFVVIMAAMALVTAPWQVLALRAVQGFFAGYGMLALTMAAESAPTAQMATAIGWVQTAQRLGPALGPAIGGGLAQAVGLRMAFVAAAGLFLGALILVLVGYREDRQRTPGAPVDVGPRVTLKTLLTVPNFGLFLAMIFGLQMVDRSFGPVLSLYLLETGTPLSRVPIVAGLIFTTAAGAAAGGNQICGWLMRHGGPRRLVAWSASLAAVGALVFSLGPSPAMILAAAALFGLGIGVAFTTVYTVAGQRVPDRSRGVAFGFLTTASLSGLALSPVVSGLLGAVTMRGVFVADALGLLAIAWSVRRMT